MNKLFFTAKWCGNCQLVKPIIKELKDVKIIDVSENMDEAIKYDILSLPGYVVVNGEEVKTMTGAKPKEIIEEFYNE